MEQIYPADSVRQVVRGDRGDHGPVEVVDEIRQRVDLVIVARHNPGEIAVVDNKKTSQRLQGNKDQEKNVRECRSVNVAGTFLKTGCSVKYSFRVNIQTD